MGKVIQNWADDGQKKMKAWQVEVKRAVLGEDQERKAHVAWQIPSLENETIKKHMKNNLICRSMNMK